MNLKFLTAFIAGMAILLSACSDENESTLDINSIQGRTVVEGKVLYNSGAVFDAEGNLKTSNYSSVADKTVYLNLDLSSLGDYDGKLVYSTKTASDGTFSIEVPANAKGIVYTIHVESFKAIKNDYTTTTTEPINIVLVPKNHYFTNTDVASLTAFENIGDYKEIKLNNSTEIQ